MKSLSWRYLIPIIALLFCTGVISRPVSLADRPHPTLILLSQERFNPAVQRLLAQQELKALPIGDSGVIFVIPMYQDPLLEEMQIRYLEQLIDEMEIDQPTADEPIKK